MTRAKDEPIPEPRYDVLWPLGRRATENAAAAPRLGSLNDRTICEIWDVMFRGEIIYPLVRDAVQARFPRATFVGYSTFGNIHGPHENAVLDELPEKLRRSGAEAAIVGIGA